jgi:hypothetical protein
VPGVVDAVTAARVRLEHAERLLVKYLSFVEDEEVRARPSEEVDWRAVIEQAIHSLQEAIEALQLALEQP